MDRALQLAWLQLRHERFRFAVALGGVAFSVVLICMQIGFQRAMFDSAVRYHNAFDYDIALISPKTAFIVQPDGFSRRRLLQALAFQGVEDVSSVYMGQANWKNPTNPSDSRAIFVVGFDPSERVFALPSINARRPDLSMPDVALFDRLSRAEFGPVAELLERHSVLRTEVAGREIAIIGLFELGTSFGIDASIAMSDVNFRRIFPLREAGRIDIGLVHLSGTADASAVRDALDEGLPDDVEIVTRQGFILREIAYWNRSTPIGYVFNFGVVIGLLVGAIIVYQILYADVSDHLQEYATLKAMGYADRFLFAVVLSEAAILALLGFLPGVGLSLILYEVAGEATRLPLELSPGIAGGVFTLTLAMCAFSGSIALRKLRTADPADIF